MSNYSNSIFTEDPNTPWFKVLKLIPESAKVLDVGCSSGNFDEIIMDRNHAVVDGIELDEGDASIAEKRLRKVIRANVETDSLDTLEGDYDIIYFGDVIEHLAHPADTLKKIKPLLNKHGAVIFSIPNMAHISVRLMLLSGKFEYGDTGLLDKTHLHYYDRFEVERVFSEAGYKIEYFDWVSRDLPKVLIERELKELGLTGTRKFFELAKKLDAAAYQFIGRAVPIDKPVKISRRKNVSPSIDMFEKYLLEIRQSYKDDIQRVEQKAINKDIEIALLKKQIQSYENSLSWRITKPLRKIKIMRKASS